MFKMTNELKNKICDFIDYCLKYEYIHTRKNVDEREYLCEQLFMYCCCDIMKSSNDVLINEQKYEFHFETLKYEKSGDEIFFMVFCFDTIEYNEKHKYKFFHCVDICNDNEIYDDEFSKKQLFDVLN